MKIKNTSIFLALFISQMAYATIYIAHVDPVTGDKALAVMSSGGISQNNTTTTIVKDQYLYGFGGFFGDGVYALDRELPKFINSGLSIQQLNAEILRIGGHTQHRLIYITGDGRIGSFISNNGCFTRECGEIGGKDFLIQGGGLEKGVLENSAKDFTKIISDHPSFPCRIFEGLKSIIRNGGERADFSGMVIALDLKDTNQIFYASSLYNGVKKPEAEMMAKVASDLYQLGYNCKL